MSTQDEDELRKEILDILRRPYNRRPPLVSIAEEIRQEKADSIMVLLREKNSAEANKWKSICGCPMCEHHSSAYSLHSTNNSLEEKI